MSATVHKPAQLAKAYLELLGRRPGLTKAVTGGLLYYVSELVSTAIARELLRRRRRLTSEALGEGEVSRKERSCVFAAQTQLNALKLALYAACIAAPLDHALYELLASVFRGRITSRARIAELVAAVAVILPLQNVVYLSALSVIQGRRSLHQVGQDLRHELVPVTRVSAVIQTLSLLFAQRFVPQPAWTPFFTGVASLVDSVINIRLKVRAGAKPKTE